MGLVKFVRADLVTCRARMEISRARPSFRLCSRSCPSGDRRSIVPPVFVKLMIGHPGINCCPLLDNLEKDLRDTIDITQRIFLRGGRFRVISLCAQVFEQNASLQLPPKKIVGLSQQRFATTARTTRVIEATAGGQWRVLTLTQRASERHSPPGIHCA
jgi:hypothetical protein